MRCPLIVAAAISLSGCTTVHIKESNFLRADKPGAAAAAPADLRAALPGLLVQDVTVAADDGVTLGGVIVRQPATTTTTATTVLYFGGNAFHLDQAGRQVLPLIASCGVNVAVFDYRGYGRSGGAPTVAKLAADAIRVFDEVGARVPGRLFVHGQSLGSFMAAHVARQRPQAAGLVLEATATTVADWANANLPWYAAPFVRLDIGESLRAVDNVAAVAAWRGPGLVLAGGRDRITPPALGRRVYAAMAPAQRQWILAEHAGHNDIIGQGVLMPAYCAFLHQGATSDGHVKTAADSSESAAVH